MAKPSSFSSKDFILEDQPRSLFPLSTDRILVEKGFSELLAAARRNAKGEAFLPQRRVYANKDALHLRRTIKLDPVAEVYLYDLIYRNRNKFRKAHSESRTHFGYRFQAGRPISPSKSYSDFRKKVFNDHIMSEEFISCDISAYFNNIYHHDLHAWFAALEPVAEEDAPAFGRYLREINAGRSLDCLPQGLYPSKMIGNDFLRFLEESSAIRAPRIARFMDDIVLLGDNANQLMADFAEVQRLLGLKGLTVNASKTRFGGETATGELDERVSDVKKHLLQRRRDMLVRNYEGDGDEDFQALDENEINFVREILQSGKLGEDDAELIMVVMRDEVASIEEHLDLFAGGFPHLAKSFYSLCKDAEDKEAVARIVHDVASSGSHIGEFQLFWFGAMLESYLLDTNLAGRIVNLLYTHSSATEISRAKILEIADQRYGLPEMRVTFLREGRSDWMAWASAVGAMAMAKQSRNYLMGYFKNGSPMNRLIAEILVK